MDKLERISEADGYRRVMLEVEALQDGEGRPAAWCALCAAVITWPPERPVLMALDAEFKHRVQTVKTTLADMRTR